MNIRSLQSLILTGFTVISGVAVPAFAADSANPDQQRGNVNTVQLSHGKGRFEGHGQQCAGGRKFGHIGMSRGHHGGGMFRSLNLTDDQFEKIFAIKNQASEQISPKVADLIVAKKELRNEMTEPNADRSKVLSLQAKINADRDAIANVKVNSKLDELAVFTPEQRQQLRERFVKWSVERGGFRRG
jgi:Spy/CpxP family protein refolding chaperone